MSEHRVVSTWYRAMRGDRLWAEASDGHEVIQRSEPGDRLERMTTVMYETPWELWRPDVDLVARLREEWATDVAADLAMEARADDE